jgi:hypothetical protein
MKRNPKTKAAERRAIERAILRTMRGLSFPLNSDSVTLTAQLQARLIGLELARRVVAK